VWIAWNMSRRVFGTEGVVRRVLRSWMLSVRISEATLSQMGKLFEWVAAVSFAPSGLAPNSCRSPTACAVGCILSPLRGWRVSNS